MTKEPTSVEEAQQEIDELWAKLKELNGGKYKSESAAFRRDVRTSCTDRMDYLTNWIADFEFNESERLRKEARNERRY